MTLIALGIGVIAYWLGTDDDAPTNREDVWTRWPAWSCAASTCFVSPNANPAAPRPASARSRPSASGPPPRDPRRPRGQPAEEGRARHAAPAIPPEPLTLWESVLLAASRLAPEFTRSELVIAAWRADERLGLPGAEAEHPSEHKVRCCLYGRLGILTRGFLYQAGNGVFSLTQAGRQLAARLGEGR